jgi:hypothetical protein
MSAHPIAVAAETSDNSRIWLNTRCEHILSSLRWDTNAVRGLFESFLIHYPYRRTQYQHPLPAQFEFTPTITITPKTAARQFLTPGKRPSTRIACRQKQCKLVICDTTTASELALHIHVLLAHVFENKEPTTHLKLVDICDVACEVDSTPIQAQSKDTHSWQHLKTCTYVYTIKYNVAHIPLFVSVVAGVDSVYYADD